jgi:hypothetical protein
MRRLFVLLVATGWLTGALGCNHTAGVCDCDPPVAHPVPHVVSMTSARVEPVKEMPRLTSQGTSDPMKVAE